jgi:signal transduction histidine kinase
VRLSKFILNNMEEILSEWESFAQTLLPAGKALNQTELRDDAENVLRAIALDMDSAQSRAQQVLKSKGGRLGDHSLHLSSHKHAQDRYSVGFDIDQLVAEYRALRASVIHLWTRKMGSADLASLEELTRFNEAIDEVLADSVARYSAIVERAKNMFLAVLGHDLRTPLSTVLAAANTLLRSEDDKTGTAKAAALILRSGKHMTQMVSDLVDFTRSRLGSDVPLVRLPMDLGVTAREVIEEIEAALPGRLRLTKSGDLRGSWDEADIKRALTNLIQNAVEHGTSGTPVTIAIVDAGEQVVFTVHNQGPAIPESERARIFEPLVGVTETSSPVVSAHMGLGLYIVRQIVEGHGGKIDVDSSQSAGTTFTVNLPRK